MTKADLISQIENYLPFDQTENEMSKRMLDFIEQHDDCFERSLLIGHITASAWIINETDQQVLLLHHKKLDKWLQPGGHCDGEEDVFAVAQKEVLEETGIDVGAQKEQIFDLDIHTIPERKGIPSHEHFDVRFKFVLKHRVDFIQNEESNGLAWIPLESIEELTAEPSIIRMAKKCLLN